MRTYSKQARPSSFAWFSNLHCEHLSRKRACFLTQHRMKARLLSESWGLRQQTLPSEATSRQPIDFIKGCKVSFWLVPSQSTPHLGSVQVYCIHPVRVFLFWADWGGGLVTKNKRLREFSSKQNKTKQKTPLLSLELLHFKSWLVSLSLVLCLYLKEEPSVPASSQHGKVSCLALTLPQWSTFSGSHLLLAQWPCRNCPPWWLSQSPPALLPSAFDLVVLNIDSSTLCSFFLGSFCFQLLFPVHLSSSVHFTL